MKTKSIFLVFCLLFICRLLTVTYGFADVPSLINYQGKLTDTEEALIRDTVSIVFTIYTDSVGVDSVWSETQDSVVVRNGIFSVLLGSTNSIPDSVFDGNIRYLGVKVGDDSEMTPRRAIVSVAYAYRAAVTDGGSAVPVGTIVAYAGTAPPDGWLICNGSEVSRTVYANLFATIGTLWGNGDGLTTFNLPDLRGRGPIGAGQGNGLTNRILSESGGEEQHTLTIAEMPSHTHSATSYDGGPSGPDPNIFDGTDSPLPFGTVTIGPTGGDQPHNSMQPYAVVNFIIKY